MHGRTTFSLLLLLQPFGPFFEEISTSIYSLRPIKSKNIFQECSCLYLQMWIMRHAIKVQLINVSVNN